MISTKYGKMEGIDHGDYMEYRKVPYAKPPVGALRFCRPQKPECWEGVYQATEYAPSCMEEIMMAPPYDKDFYADPAFTRQHSEDCLYLNIWAPKEAAPAETYPVAYWIHGGAFMGGYATELEFDGAEYARRGVILVSVEYRCNIFGFLAHPWLSAEDPEHISGNYGLYDQIAGLDWVIENIAAFGGDPKNITVFGQSAGAMSTQTLISSRLTEGKIAKAIMQSGGSYKNGLHNDLKMETAEHYGEVFTEMFDIHSTEELRAIPAEEMMARLPQWVGRLMPEAKGLFLTPNIDGKLLDDGYYKIMEDGRILNIPYMLGWNKDDIDVMPQQTPTEYKEHAQSFLAEGCTAFSDKLEELGREATFVYEFERALPGDFWGAYHSAELFYTFGTMKRTWRPWTEADFALSAKIIDYWTSFMKTGDPNGKEHPVWERCRKENPAVMHLDVQK